ncbi:hypothetical protein F5144DRAFT_303722 [Chaetomium tenue]|uniref:Uncharacterized protein n=1 Tax=Chaetomium tenue TaxID=1854479 RepID=A0ACB7P3M2_9PEZI|nr:hypothetical protein F5144DRAFT_303722 [Chaetomium globosum]
MYKERRTTCKLFSPSFTSSGKPPQIIAANGVYGWLMQTACSPTSRHFPTRSCQPGLLHFNRPFSTNNSINNSTRRQKPPQWFDGATAQVVGEDDAMSNHISVNEKGFTVLYEGKHPTIDIVFVHGFTGHPKDTWLYKAKAHLGTQAKQHAHNGDPSDVVWRSKIRKFGWRFSATASIAPSAQHSRATLTNDGNTNGIMQIEGQRQEDIYWPADLVPQTVPSSRILTYGYDTRIGHRLTGRPVSKKSAYDHAWDFLCEFEYLRRNINEKSRPVLFIAHSLGGIIVKEALRRARSSKSTKPHLYNIFGAAAGFILFGTPHRGADPRSFLHHLLSTSVQVLGVQVNKGIVNTLMPNTEELAQLMDEFLVMAQEKCFQVYSFQEEYGLKSLFGTKVVEDWSSCLNNPVLETKQFISSNHMDMCRFSGLKDSEYTKVAAALNQILGTIESREGTVKCRQTSKGGQSPGTAHEPPISEQGIQNNNGSHQTLDLWKLLVEKLYFTEIDERLTNLTAAQRGTCRWFLNTPEYTSWREPTQQPSLGSFLWIWGHPGTGKSTLMKLLFEEVKGDAKLSQKGSASPITLSFFFLARGTLEERSTNGLYRSLLYQLFKEAADLQHSLQEALTISGAKNIHAKGWNEEALKQTLNRAVRRLGDRPLTIFVDALDECDDDQARGMVGFFEDLCELAQDRKNQLRICLSSRHYPHIETKGRNIILEDEAGHREDIEKYIKKTLRLPESKDAQSLRSEILEASRMIFLWVVLVVDILNRDYPSKPIKQMSRRLREIPKELGDLFEMILQRDGQNPEALQLCLKWILFAERPMKLQELYFAVQFGLGEEEGCPGAWNQDDLNLNTMKCSVKEWSKGLSEIKGKASVVQFIHESVRDFLLGQYKHRWDKAPEDIEGRGHETLKNCCLAQVKAAAGQGLHMPSISMQLRTKVDQYRKTIRSKFPFLQYSILKILHHANSAQNCGLDQEYFLGQFPLEGWKALYNLLEGVEARRYGAEVSLLFLLAERNLANLIKFFPPERSCFYLETGIISPPRYGPPLFAALATGGNEAARALLEAEVKGKPRESQLRSLLKYRPEEGEKLGDFDFKFRFSKRKGPLLHVAEQGYATLLEVLLETALDDIDVNFRDPSSGRSPLSHSAGRGIPGMATLLLEKGADIAQGDKDGRTPLSYAAEMGHRDMVTLLLENGADIEQQDKGGRGPLSHAIGHLDMTRLLLEKGADIAQRDRQGRTPVSYAAELGDLDTVTLLLRQKGADIEQKGIRGRNLISYAAEGGNLSIVTLLLLQCGLGFDLEDKNGRTPLSHASYWGKKSVVKTLLEKGADIERRDKGGRAPLTFASIGVETEEVLRVLCGSGAQIDTKDQKGRTPLHWAAAMGINTPVEILCASGSQVDSKDALGRTPLSWAAEAGKCRTLQLLQQLGAQIDAPDEQGCAPLSWAARAGRLSAVDCLLKMGANIRSEDNQGHTPLWYATQASNKMLVELLRRRLV